MYNEKLSKQKNGAIINSRKIQKKYMKNIIIVHYGSVVNNISY